MTSGSPIAAGSPTPGAADEPVAGSSTIEPAATNPDRGFLTTPPDIATMPPGVPYIIGNEAAERFSFYGMKAVLFTYMTQFLVNAAGEPATFSPERAKAFLHLFVMSAYFLPVAGALLADIFWGKYRTIIWLSLVYCLGHVALAAVPGQSGLLLGLALIAIGAGGIKPCVSAHVGDQFGPRNEHLVERVFAWFYFSINVGATISMLLTPWLMHEAIRSWGPSLSSANVDWELSQKHYGPHLAFGVPALLMMLATFVFWLGRNTFVHRPAAGPQAFFTECLSPAGLLALLRLLPLYVFVAVFWSLFDQSASAWVAQAKSMDRRLFADFGLLPESLRSWDVLADQLQSLNGLMVLVLVPLFTYVVYPAVNRLVRLTPLMKIQTGFILAAISFAVCSWAQERLDAGLPVTAWWQVWAYLLLTAAEVLVSVTCLEFSYTQAPPQMKSLVMSFYLLSVAAGNGLTAGINLLMEYKWLQLENAAYFWFFTALMGAAAVFFLPVLLLFPTSRPSSR